MRRVFALLLLTPILASCADSSSPTPVAPAAAVLSEGEVPTEGEWPVEENWFTPEGMISLPEEEISAMAAPGTDVVMTFGNPDAGTNFPSGAHDASFHGKDRVIPGTVVIDAGQQVTFQVFPTHRVAIYKPGVRPQDITATNAGPFILTPSTGRLALQAAPGNPAFKFNVPGRYLVICAVKSHFFVANMYGWVIVR
jgi:plastocyanin